MNTQQIFKGTLVILTTLIASFMLITNVRILIVLLIAIIIASALRPYAAALHRIGIPNGLAITLVYLLLGLGIAVLLVIVLPPIVRQLANYMENEWQLATRIIVAQNWFEQQLSHLANQEIQLGNSEELRQAVYDLIAQIRISAPSALLVLGNTVGEALLVFVMGVYWLTARDKAITFLASLVPQHQQQRFVDIAVEVETTMGSYVRGIMLVGSFVGLANFVILALFRVSNAATLAFIIGLTTMLPVVGGFIGAGTATLLALLVSPLQGLIVFATFVVVQQVEMNVITPRVMAQSVGIDPLLVILAVFVGFAMYGPTGALIAVPLAGALAVLVQRLIVEPRIAELRYEVHDGGILLSPPPQRPNDRNQVIETPANSVS